MVEVDLQNYTKSYKRRGISMDLLRKIYDWMKSNQILVELGIVTIPTIWVITSGFINLPKNVQNISDQLESHIEDYKKLDDLFGTHINNYNNLAADSKSHNGNVEFSNSSDAIYIDNINGDIYIGMEYNGDIIAPELSGDSVLTESDGTTISASNLVGEKLIIPYQENNQEVYFMGQYDENILWNGECLINTYSKNKLVNSTLAQYEHGKRKSYEQIYCEDNEWIYSIRTIIDDDMIKSEEEKIKSGDTWKYSKTKDYEQSIDYDSPLEDDFVYPNALKIELDEKLISRYHGNTSNGTYNDDTNSAYIIKFTEDGTVRTLYYGNFKDGDFDDNTKLAWYITRNPETNTNYMYYMGIFEGGNSDSEDKTKCAYFENPLTRGTFNRLLSDKSFDCPMLWAEEYISNTVPPVEE